ncbi:hypothetical protein SBP1_gp065 [Vibrio virus vB_VspP_SBP1]|uniref:Uncharacterized protein n=1 Tax=Vibrio virus vB_VspP_SBP1 TaxID=2500581 RepID=A0A3T0IIJ8_9CAUD|nr:hypothetical protein KNU36_gp064 [Vibrio virus vB_VspP_SBP1]AZU99657.1 hypothetical protein SBP1_gp065 [Vibrio virus vB_VspP_SBP1]
MDWKDLGKTVASAAPVLGGLLGGPVGTAAGTLIASVFGANPNPEDVAAAIKNDPDALVRLKEIELNHKEEIHSMTVRELELRLADKQSARTMQMNTQSNVPALLTGGIMALLTAALLALFTVTIPDGNRDMVNMLIGALIGFGSTAIAFWLGADEQKRRGEKP